MKVGRGWRKEKHWAATGDADGQTRCSVWRSGLCVTVIRCDEAGFCKGWPALTNANNNHRGGDVAA